VNVGDGFRLPPVFRSYNLPEAAGQNSNGASGGPNFGTPSPTHCCPVEQRKAYWPLLLEPKRLTWRGSRDGTGIRHTCLIWT
jgi:hypothetical protein